MNKLLDRLMHWIGYVRLNQTIQGRIDWKSGGSPFVNLTIPNGTRVSGWVVYELPIITYRDDAFKDLFK